MKKIIFIAILVLSLVGCSNNQTRSVAEALFSHKDTDVYNEADVNSLIDAVNMSSYEIESTFVRNDNDVSRLTVNIKVDDRANHRHIDNEALNKTTALMFSLVPNSDEICYLFFDNYKDVGSVDTEVYNHDLSFNGSYYNRNFLYTRRGMERFTSQYIADSVKSPESFEQYYNAVMSIKVPDENSLVYDAVNQAIGSDCEIVTNSGLSTKLELNSKFFESENYKVLKDIMTVQFKNTIGKHNGKTAELTKYDIRNFKTGETKKCVFLYYTDDEHGVTMIDFDYLENDDEIKAIRKIISEE